MTACGASDRAKNLSRRSSLKSVGTCGLIGVHRIVKSRSLIARVITVEIKMLENASEALDRDPTVIVSRRFVTREHVASSEFSIGDPTAAI